MGLLSLGPKAWSVDKIIGESFLFAVLAISEEGFSCTRLILAAGDSFLQALEEY